ncbi:outer membrane protein [Methylocystis iwaonis]|uniref:Outer-membrane immunogenic protein n=1 Tax=Methylocystis iwaonis TaxID=2885079 RepID=A0ABM8EA30_9HYPH|nr:outer membrane beta-barrel protein [Methylocystis iwaonis]BDV34718.1 outer-membrane immunogenic protein [Methylocystis iwaonis]
MKKVALSVAALALTAGSALAADLPSRKGPPVLPPPPPPAPLWTGFYVGLNAGGTWASSNAINTVGYPIFSNGSAGGVQALPVSAALASSSLSANSGGFIGGGQIGYNWQFYNRFVVGVEADIQGIAGSSNNVSGVGIANTSINGPLVSISSARRNIDYIGTVRGRLGWLATPTLLLYGTGGLAYAGVTLNSSVFQQFTVNPVGNVGNAYFSNAAFSDTRVGWTAGGGVEWMFWPNWSAKVEYLYYDLGNVTVAQNALVNVGQVAAVGNFTGVAPQTTTRFNGHIVRAGLNYHFNWGAPAPIVAKY